VSQLISIILPVYNRSSLLREALRSCLKQTYSPIEVIVSDDGSEEDVKGVVEEFRSSRSDVCFRYVRQTKRGASAARNLGFEKSSGELIQFLDSDDLLHPEKLARQHTELEMPNIDMVFSLGEHFYKRPGDYGVLWNGLFQKPSVEHFLAQNVPWDTNAPLWKRKALEKIGPWNESLMCSQDLEFHVRALCKGAKVHQVPKVLHYIRDHEQERISSSLVDATEQETSRVLAWELIADQLQTSGHWNTPNRYMVAVAIWQKSLPIAWRGLKRLATRSYLNVYKFAPLGALKICARLGYEIVQQWSDSRVEPPRALRLLHRSARVARIGLPFVIGWKQYKYEHLVQTQASA
jgi:glycosyltransferase involved in cell wall biosynthesis